MSVSLSKETPIDFDARYKVEEYGGVAFYLLGYATRSVPVMYISTFNDDGEYDPDGEEREVESDEFDEVEDRQWVRAVMVGDDTVHIVEVDDLTVIGEDDYCSECGQVGCTADGRDRS